MSQPAPEGNTERSPRRGMCAAVLCLEAIALGLTTPVLITVAGVETGTALAVVPIALQIGAQGSTLLTWLTPVGMLLLGMVLLPTLLSWTVMEGLRTLVGRHDVIAG